MNMISLTSFDLGLAAMLVVILALLSRRMQLGLEGQLLIAAARTVVQLLLIGLVLESLFSHVNLLEDRQFGKPGQPLHPICPWGIYFDGF